jgi:hypothetical protein
MYVMLTSHKHTFLYNEVFDFNLDEKSILVVLPDFCNFFPKTIIDCYALNLFQGSKTRRKCTEN